ncbi:MAG: hydroxyacylglutathione hydrolase [Burkholderiaceae bacterium]|jgi:hydroxyacylglutathione hydrolase
MNQTLQIFFIPAFQDNYVWIIHDSAAKLAAVVDPGDAAPVLDWLETSGCRLTALLITHHHADHVGGIGPLLEHARRQGWPAPPVHGPALETIAHMTHPQRDGDTVTIDALGWTAKVLDVPGHTVGHIAYFSTARSEHPVLFCGDTLFAAGCGRLMGGTAEQLFTSLQKLATLPDDTRVYCAHEYTLANLHFARAADPNNPAIAARLSTVASMRARGEPTLPSLLLDEKGTNPFIRAQNIDEFVRLRTWKDHFRI